MAKVSIMTTVKEIWGGEDEGGVGQMGVPVAFQLGQILETVVRRDS